jgi:quinol monooxygenase YgiN
MPVFGLVVRFDLGETHAVDFDALVAETVERIRSEEPGTLVYTCHEVRDDPQARIFYKRYKDEEAFNAHEEQDHVKHFLSERTRYLTSAPRVEFLHLTLGKGFPLG